jgi:hypothetical protein
LTKKYSSKQALKLTDVALKKKTFENFVREQRFQYFFERCESEQILLGTSFIS